MAAKCQLGTLPEGNGIEGKELTLLFFLVFDLSAKSLFKIMTNGIEPLYFFFSGMVLVVKLVFLLDELFYFRLQCLMTRQLLQTLGIKIAFGGVQNDEVAVVIVTIFLTGFFILAGFQLINHIPCLVVICYLVTECFLFLDGSFNRFHLGANIT